MLDLLPVTQPATSYEAAYQQFEELVQRDPPEVDPRSRARLLTPGHRTERAIVFFHGLTNSPRQFESLAQRFVSRGYSVFIPRVPYHGYADRMSTDHAKLTVAEMVEFASASVDLASGLADDVTVSGISLGGVLAIWAAQYRPVAIAAPIAPALGVPVLPYAPTCAAFALMGRLPNRFIWWDPRNRERLAGPDYAYPRFATHALAATQSLGAQLVAIAKSRRPAAKLIWMISNEADFAVSNSASQMLVRRWRAHGTPPVRTFRFPRQLKMWHDIVDPLQPHTRPEIVHPILERILAGEPSPVERSGA